MATPTVSVIIPTCNRLDMLVRSVGSVLAQTAKPLEIIVVNDAGKAIEETIKGIDQDGLVRIVNHDSNKGASAARNSGLAVAKGEYIAYLDDDDLYQPGHLETVIPQLHASSCRFGYAFAEYVIDDIRNGELMEVGRVQPYTGIPYSHDRLLVANFIPTPTWVFERSLIAEVGNFDESFAACEDWEWLIRASEKTDFLSVQAVTVEVRQRLYDEQHLILQHRPKMNMWIRAVYAKHPVESKALQLARHEHITFGSAKDYTPEQQALVTTAFAGAKDGTLDLIGLFNVTETMDATNHRHQSVELYRLWLEHTTSPLRHAACFNLGVVAQNLGLMAEAEAMYREAIKLNPAFGQALLNLAGVLEQRGSVDEALELWRKVVRQERAAASLAYTQATNHLKRYLEV
ncbi:MAG: glycosyltransferase [Pseudomonadota bacterium]